jgi:hypothetical protein
MYLVDTNVVSKGRRGSAEALKWLRSVNPLDMHLSVITIGEVMRGIAFGNDTRRLGYPRF